LDVGQCLRTHFGRRPPKEYHIKVDPIWPSGSREDQNAKLRGQMSGDGKSSLESWSKNTKNSNTHFCILVSVVWKRVELQYTKLIPALIPCQWTVLLLHDWSWSTRTQKTLCTDGQQQTH